MSEVREAVSGGTMYGVPVEDINGVSNRDGGPQDTIQLQPNTTLCTHIPKCKNWRDVIVHWEEGCPEKNLVTHLKDWSATAPNGTRKMASKYSDRKRVAEEYKRLGEENFIDEYSPDDVTLIKLKELIRKAQN